MEMMSEYSNVWSLIKEDEIFFLNEDEFFDFFFGLYKYVCHFWWRI